MKHYLLIGLIGATFLLIHPARPVRILEEEIPLIGHNPGSSMAHYNQDQESQLIDESTQQLLIAGSVLLTGLMLKADINHMMKDPLKQQAFMKGCVAYITGKQIQHFYKDNPVAQEAGTLLAHYGRTMVALLLIYG